MQTGILGTLLACAATSFAAAGFAGNTSAQEYTLEIARQPITATLQEFSKQTGLDVAFVAKSDDHKNLLIGPLKGRYTVESAFNELLANTDLTFARVNAVTIAVITRSDKRAGLVSRTADDLKPRFQQLADRELVGETAEEGGVHRVAAVGSTEASRSSRTEQVSELGRIRKMEEVVVTATRRAENIQDIPLSIAVVTAEDIDRRRLANAEDYLRGIPGVNQVDSYTGQSIVIRGIETSPLNQNFGAGATTATYFGETPTTNSAGLGGGTNVDLKLVDIERVEVLRGPQGTTFGSSSMGGAVRTIPVAPKTDHFEAKLAAGYSVTSGTGGDNYSLQAVGNIPLIKDRLAVRATAYRFDDSGFYDNVAGSDPAFQAAVTQYGAQPFAIDEEEVGSYYAAGGRIAALLQATSDLRFTVSYLSQKTEINGFAAANSGAYEQTLLEIAPDHVLRGQKGGLADSDIDIGNAMMEYSFGWADLLATYSYVKSQSVQSFSGSLGLSSPVSYSGPSDHREDVSEIRLVTQLDGAWNFLAGLYMEELKDEVLFDYRWMGDPATNSFNRGQLFVGDYLDRRILKQKAAFGEASWEFLPGFTLTGGIRAYDYERTVRTNQSGPLFGGVRSTDTDADASGSSLRGNLSYKLDDRGLVYAGWSQGFRLGKPQPGLPGPGPGTCDVNGDGVVDGTNITLESTRSIESDDVDSYEVGGKFALLDRRLTIDAAVFRMEWSGLPVRVIAGSRPASCGLGYITNAGDAVSEGVEVQATLQITEPFRVAFGGSWIDARLTEDVPAQGFSSDDRLPGSPEFNANLGLQYGFEIGGYSTFVRADSTYVGSFYGNVQQSPNLRAGDYVKVDTSARVEIGNLKIDVFVRNLTNEDAFTFRGATSAGISEFFGYRLRPRTIGVQLGYSF